MRMFNNSYMRSNRKFIFGGSLMSTQKNVTRWIWKSITGLIFAAAIIISSCEDVTNIKGGIAEYSELAALSVSSAKVGDPIPIYDVDELELIGDTYEYPANGDYILEDDLTLTSWTPICDPTAGRDPFTGTFDGNGHTITVLSYASSVLNNNTYIGIFAVLGGVEDDPSVSNLTVEPMLTITTAKAQYVGGIAGYARNTVFTNITIDGILNATSSNSVANYNVGGVSGFAASSSFINVHVEDLIEGQLNVPPPSPDKWEIWRGDGTFRVRSPLAVTGQDGVTTGGVVGYAKNSQFRSITVTGSVQAEGRQQKNPAYAGGVVGAGDGLSIDDAYTSVTVTGDGNGYNTSAGGVAGYILESRVRNSSAAGAVNAVADSASFGWSDSWQVYAGGLVGYAGGTDTAPSQIDHSNATGNVSADSPFPYAGGLVGYLYGFNDFTNPAKNGSTVNKSCAAGNVTAISEPDPSLNYGDIPYAGGLVGYSSVIGSTIVDSYARGNVNATTLGAYAWAGGIIGGNANDAVVLRTYATGTVESDTGTRNPLYAPDYAPSGPAAGGIAGFNYYTAKTSVSNSVALNTEVDGDQSIGQDVVHRVVGSIGDGSGHDGVIYNNLAYENMDVHDNWKPEYGANRRDGANTAKAPNKDVYTDLSWDFTNTWTIGSDGYPIIK
jgi:hypothetical protein